MRLIDRLKARCKVEPATGCWEWQQGHNGAGYPQISLRPISSSAINVRRLVYLLEVGQLPKGRLVTSSCQDPLCINPAHLRPTTRQAVAKKNAREMNAKLTPDYRKAIWRRRKEGKPAGSVSKQQQGGTTGATAERPPEPFWMP
jgi:hypothetical protein